MAWIDTDYAVGELLKELRNSGGTFPGTWYVGLFTTTPTSAGTGGVEIASSPTHSNAITFTSSSPTAPGTVTAIGLFDALTSGNLWHVLTLTTPLTIGVGSLVSFPVGQIIQEFNAS
jgi:hypothetical protein